MSPRKGEHETIERVFTPPRPTANGCLLPGPGGSADAFSSTSVRARTEAGDRPAWWCKFDKLVIFDCVETLEDGATRIHARTSKGLTIARRRGDLETVIVPMSCSHCQDMLRRQEWKYDVRVCKRSVCWDCKERCKWESQQEEIERDGRDEVELATRVEGNRYRADSVLRDDEQREEELLRKVGIEQSRPHSPIDIVGGIAERLESREEMR